jgi:hypothetical protein
LSSLAGVAAWFDAACIWVVGCGLSRSHVLGIWAWLGACKKKCLKRAPGCLFTLLTQPMAGSKRARVIEWVERIMPDVVASVWPQDDGSTGPFYLQCPCYAGSVKRRARPGPGALGATQRLGHGGLADQVLQVGPTAVFPPPVAGPSGPSPLEATSIDSPRRRSLNGLGGLGPGLTEGGTSAARVSRTPVPAPTRPTARTSRAQLFQCLVRDEHSVSQHVKSLRHQACE